MISSIIACFPTMLEDLSSLYLFWTWMSSRWKYVLKAYRMLLVIGKSPFCKVEAAEESVGFTSPSLVLEPLVFSDGRFIITGFPTCTHSDSPAMSFTGRSGCGITSG